MEKYKRFTDVATGINPFTGPATEPPTTLRLAATWIVALPLMAVPLLLISLIHGVLTLFATLLPIPVISQALQWLAAKFCAPAFLWIFSWSSVVSTPYPAAKSTLSARNDQAKPPSPGDVILVNCQSPLDVLALQVAYPRYPITYCFPAVAVPLGDETGPSNDTEAFVRINSVFSAMSYMLSWSKSAPSAEKTSAPPARSFDLTLFQISAERTGRVLVVFAEGASSNGRGVLALPALMFAKTQSTHVAALSYSNPYHALVLPFKGSLVMWLVECLSKSLLRRGTVDIAQVRTTHIPAMPTAFSLEWSSAVQSRIALAASFNRPMDAPCRTLASTATDKRFFLAYWGLYNSSAAATPVGGVAAATPTAGSSSSAAPPASYRGPAASANKVKR